MVFGVCLNKAVPSLDYFPSLVNADFLRLLIVFRVLISPSKSMTSFTPSKTGINEYNENTNAQTTSLLIVCMCSLMASDSPPRLINATNIMMNICRLSMNRVALLLFFISLVNLLCSSRDKSSATFFLVSDNLWKRVALLAMGSISIVNTPQGTEVKEMYLLAMYQAAYISSTTTTKWNALLGCRLNVRLPASSLIVFFYFTIAN